MARIGRVGWHSPGGEIGQKGTLKWRYVALGGAEWRGHPGEKRGDEYEGGCLPHHNI